jgi:hypothetical protein
VGTAGRAVSSEAVKRIIEKSVRVGRAGGGTMRNSSVALYGREVTHHGRPFSGAATLTAWSTETHGEQKRSLQRWRVHPDVIGHVSVWPERRIFLPTLSAYHRSDSGRFPSL